MDRNPLARLGEFGQSAWCDDIGRDLLLAGRLKHLIEHDGISGVTSNPTIFQKAISGSSSYDDAFRSLAGTGASAAEIMEGLMVADIRMAADQLRPTYAATSTRDGYVSIEVAPSFAHDTRGTVAEAIRLFALVDRPNVLVKVPGTAEGVNAVRELTARGYSINITLIFSLERYSEVMEAYLSGLEVMAAQEQTAGEASRLAKVHSVASFFVSRVDTEVDKRLDALVEHAAGSERQVAGWNALKGKAAVANAKRAYQMFRQTFSGERWDGLQTAGATIQRPLWASTSTKNPAYNDIMYVEELIGRDTINTMPLKTMDAFRDHGRPAETIITGVEEAKAHLRALHASGIRMDDVTSQLEREGIEAFATSYDGLLQALEQKRGGS